MLNLQQNAVAPNNDRRPSIANLVEKLNLIAKEQQEKEAAEALENSSGEDIGRYDRKQKKSKKLHYLFQQTGPDGKATALAGVVAELQRKRENSVEKDFKGI